MEKILRLAQQLGMLDRQGSEQLQSIIDCRAAPPAARNTLESLLQRVKQKVGILRIQNKLDYMKHQRLVLTSQTVLRDTKALLDQEQQAKSLPPAPSESANREHLLNLQAELARLIPYNYSLKSQISDKQQEHKDRNLDGRSEGLQNEDVDSVMEKVKEQCISLDLKVHHLKFKLSHEARANQDYSKLNANLRKTKVLNYASQVRLKNLNNTAGQKEQASSTLAHLQGIESQLADLESRRRVLLREVEALSQENMVIKAELDRSREREVYYSSADIRGENERLQEKIAELREAPQAMETVPSDHSKEPEPHSEDRAPPLPTPKPPLLFHDRSKQQAKGRRPKSNQGSKTSLMTVESKSAKLIEVVKVQFKDGMRLSKLSQKLYIG